MCIVSRFARLSGNNAGHGHDHSGRYRSAVIYERHWGELCGYLRSTFGAGPPEPEDVAQAAFARLVQMDDRQDIQNPQAFLQTIAHNIAISELRKASTHERYPSDGIHKIFEDAQVTISQASASLYKEEQFAIVREALARMPHKRRRVLLLNSRVRLVAGRGRPARADDLAVGKHLRRALADLQGALKAVELSGRRTAQRRVALTGGEAFFCVAKDVARPFVADAGDSLVQAVGTKFDVLRGPGQARISVVEGVVEVRRPRDGLSIPRQALRKIESEPLLHDGMVRCHEA